MATMGCGALRRAAVVGVLAHQRVEADVTGQPGREPTSDAEPAPGSRAFMGEAEDSEEPPLLISERRQAAAARWRPIRQTRLAVSI